MRDRPLLLDTHVWLWLVEGAPEIKPNIRKLVRDKMKVGTILIPAISVWEVGMLSRKHRIQLTKPVHEWVTEAFDKTGFMLVPLSQSIALEATMLPGDFHSDPADSMIVATARIEDASLLTRDRRILDYSNKGHLSTIPV